MKWEYAAMGLYSWRSVWDVHWGSVEVSMWGFGVRHFKCVGGVPKISVERFEMVIEFSMRSFRVSGKKNPPQGAFKPKLYFCICDYIDWIQEQATDCH